MHTDRASTSRTTLTTALACAIAVATLTCGARLHAQATQTIAETGAVSSSASATIAAGRNEPVRRTVAGLRLLEITIGSTDAAANATLPLIVFIHGRGDVAHAEWIAGVHTPGRYVFPQAKTPHGRGFSWFLYNGLGPATAQLAADLEVCAGELATLLAALRAERPASGKAIVSGFSQGGVLSYALALLHPDQVALAVPIAGLLPEPLFAKLPKPGVRYPPIHALHGTEDNIVPIDAAALLTDTLHARGIDITLQRFAGLGHEVPEQVRARVFERIRGGIDALSTPRKHAEKPASRPRSRAAVGGKAKRTEVRRPGVLD
jgi:phospholipase/carboxylesterase